MRDGGFRGFTADSPLARAGQLPPKTRMKQFWMQIKTSATSLWEQLPPVCRTRMVKTVLRYVVVAAGVVVDTQVDNALAQLATTLVVVVTALAGAMAGREHDKKDAAIATASATLEDADGDGIPDAVEQALAALKTIRSAPRQGTVPASPETSTTIANEEDSRNS